MVDIKIVKTQVQFLASCYPQLQWDGAMTAGAWFTMLNEIDATEEELKSVCNYIVKNGFESWKINIALIIDLIVDKRKTRQDEIKSQEYLRKMDEKPRLTPEEFNQVMSEFKEKINEIQKK